MDEYIGTNTCIMDYDLYKYDITKIKPLADRIAALEKTKGLDGREIELAKRLFPDTAPPDDIASYAVMWRLIARAGETQEDWKLLILMSEIKGSKGDTGDTGEQGKDGAPGKDGSGLDIANVVNTEENLYSLPTVVIGGFYVVSDVKHVFIYKGTSTTGAGDRSQWVDLGLVVAQKGDKGDKGDRGNTGPRGATGKQGESGGISQFLLQWIVDSATSSAISGAMIEVNTAINDAIETMANQLATLAEDAAQSAVEEALDGLMDEFKGDKGEKGDKGDDGEKGKDGKSVRLVGKYDLLASFMASYPAIASNVGVAALIGKDGEEKVLWAVTETPTIGGLPAHYTYEELGDILGPKGEPGKDAEWSVSIRDSSFVEKMSVDVSSDLPQGVASMYIQESKSIRLEPTSGSSVDPNQVGFSIHMKYPIPTLIKEGEIGSPTVDKFLTNDGTKLEWVDIDLSTDPQEVLYIKSPNNTVFKITITDDGRLEVKENV